MGSGYGAVLGPCKLFEVAGSHNSTQRGITKTHTNGLKSTFVRLDHNSGAVHVHRVTSSPSQTGQYQGQSIAIMSTQTCFYQMTYTHPLWRGEALPGGGGGLTYYGG